MRINFERFLTLCALAALCLPGAALADSRVHIVVYGDSLTSGYQLQPEEAYPAKLERKLKEVGFNDIDVVNMSVAGETTAGGVERLPSLLLRSPDVVIVELGSNDGLRGLNIDFIYNNLGTILSGLAATKAYIVLIGAHAPPNMGAAYSARFDDMYTRLSGAFGAALYPFALEGVVGRGDLNLADGMHPNSRGVDVMVENTYRLVDAGVRWKMDLQRYQQQQQGSQLAPPVTAAPPPAAPEGQ